MDYSISGNEKQEVYSTNKSFTSQVKPPPRQRNIARERAIWEEKKKRTAVMAERLRKVGKINRYFRMRDCADTIVSDVCVKCETRYVTNTNFCRDRLCPVCSWRRSKRLTKKLGEIIRVCEMETHSRYIFLTLTVRNVPWSELANQIKVVMASWDRMRKRIKRAAVVTGWIKTFEVTRSKIYGNAHPHLHILLQVPPEYFDRQSDKYLFHRKDELIQQWKECLQAEYSPSISINAVKDTDYGIGRAVTETTKYIAKNTDIEGLDDTDFSHYVNAIHHVRSWSTGGRMKISDDEIDEFLHDTETTHDAGICGNCGGGLIEMREVWDKLNGVYRVKLDVNFKKIDSLTDGLPGLTGGQTGSTGKASKQMVININVNEGGNCYVGDVDG